MNKKERAWMVRQAEISSAGYPDAMKELKLLNPTYHFCNEWDGMVICDEDPEWEVCLCDIKKVTNDNI